jgi:O-antigen/teichoic acid export membrane protein
MLVTELKRLARHSAVYGVGAVVPRVLALVLLPLYTRYLTPADYGAVETLLAASAVLATVLRAGIGVAFVRFWFLASDPERRLTVLRTAFVFPTASASAGLVAGLSLAEPISELAFGSDAHAGMVRAASVALWAQMSFEQLAAVFRVEERSRAFVAANLASVAITVAATVLLVVVAGMGGTGVLLGNATGALVVYAALLVYRRPQLGLQFDRSLLREMNRFGLPLVPGGLAAWTTNFGDRLFLVKLADATEVALYSVGFRLASALTVFFVAFRTAWPVFAYSIEDDREARRTYSFVLTYVLFIALWLALALSLLAPWLVRLLTTPAFYEGSRVVAPLSFAAVLFAGYLVVGIGLGRARRTGSNWTVTGSAVLVNVVLNLLLIPPFGMMGAAAATLAAYALMFAGIAWYAQRVFPVPYQWRRVATLAAAAVGLTVAGKLLDPPLAVAVALVTAYPLVLLPLGFYLPAERARLRTAGRRFLPLPR